jgi:hypothetical protein
MQLSVRDDAAAKLAEDAGIKVIMNRCPKIEYGRLSSEISWMGVNSRTLSSRRAKVSGKGVQRMSLDRTSIGGGSTSATDAAQRAQQEEMAEAEKDIRAANRGFAEQSFLPGAPRKACISKAARPP